MSAPLCRHCHRITGSLNNICANCHKLYASITIDKEILEAVRAEPQAQSVEADLTPEQQLAFLKGKADMCHGNMEGEDLQGFLRWDKLYNAYLTIAEDMEREMKGLPPILEPETDQPQQPTAREMLEALIEYYDNNKRWFLSSSRRSGVEYKGLTGIALLEFAEQWLKEKTKER